jgi:hypothetical protein
VCNLHLGFAHFNLVMVVSHGGKEQKAHPGKNGVIVRVQIRQQWGKLWGLLVRVLATDLRLSELDNYLLD